MYRIIVITPDTRVIKLINNQIKFTYLTPGHRMTSAGRYYGNQHSEEVELGDTSDQMRRAAVLL